MNIGCSQTQDKRDAVFSKRLYVQMEDSEGTVRQIGAFSEGIQNLTVSPGASTGIKTPSDPSLRSF